jgi:choline-sulfatase
MLSGSIRRVIRSLLPARTRPSRTGAPVHWLCALVLLPALSECAPSAGPANVILITMDTTRADRLGCYGCEVAATPALDSVSARSTVFENAHAAAPITLPSHMTIMTGRKPVGHSIRYNGWERSDTTLTTLAERLADEGYTTAAFVSAYVLKRHYYVSRGFQSYDDDFRVERSDEETAARAISFLEKKPAGPLFLWVHFFDPHDPYEPPEPYASATRGGAYDAEISAMDHAIGRLLSALERLGYAENAHIILVADHGEGLGERAGYMNHGMVLYEEATRVPLLWHTPGQKTGRHDKSLVGCVGIFPTVLDVLGIKRPAESEGISLASRLTGKRSSPRAGLYTETASPYVYFKWSPLFGWQTDRYKYIAASVPELYDLEKDPGELRNLTAERPALAESLCAELRSYLDRWGAEARSADDADDEGERAALESLGYIQSTTRDPEPADPNRVPRIDELDGLASPRDHIAVFEEFTDALLTSRRGNWKRVIEIYRRILEKLPESPAVPLALAEAYLALGRPAEALSWLERHLAFRPGDPGAQRMLGDALLGVGRYADAAAAYGRIPVAETDANLHFARVRLAVMLGDEASARSEVRILREKFPRHTQFRDWEDDIDLLSRLGTDRPAPADRDLDRQVHALLSLGLTMEARGLTGAGAGAHPESLLARLRGDVAFAAQDWCAAQEAYGRAAALGNPTRLGPRLTEARQRCRPPEPTRARPGRSS